MRMDLDRATGIHLIAAHSPGVLRVGERSFARSLIVSASEIVADWRPLSIEDLEPRDLDPLLALHPEVALIGSGRRQAFPGREVLAALHGSRLGFEIMSTAAACRTYNVLVAEGRRVAAALILEPA